MGLTKAHELFNAIRRKATTFISCLVQIQIKNHYIPYRLTMYIFKLCLNTVEVVSTNLQLVATNFLKTTLLERMAQYLRLGCWHQQMLAIM